MSSEAAQLLDDLDAKTARVFAGKVVRKELVRNLKRAINGEPSPEAEPFVPKTAFCSKRDYEVGAWRGCFEAWEVSRR